MGVCWAWLASTLVALDGDSPSFRLHRHRHRTTTHPQQVHIGKWEEKGTT